MTSRTHFSISVPPSVASSRSASPAPSYSDTYGSDYQYNKTNLEFHKKQQQLNAILGNGKETDCPGQRSTDVYDRTLPAWRARVRRMLVRTVEKESRIIAKMQVRLVSCVCSRERIPRANECLFSERNSNTMARLVFRVYVVIGNSYVLHDPPTRIRVLWASGYRSWVRLPSPPSSFPLASCAH